jgi:hypothetical protein
MFPQRIEKLVAKIDDKVGAFIQRIQNKPILYFDLFFTCKSNRCCLPGPVITTVEVGIAVPFCLFIFGKDTLATEMTFLMALTCLISQIPKRFLWRYRPYMVGRAKKVFYNIKTQSAAQGKGRCKKLVISIPSCHLRGGLFILHLLFTNVCR